MFRPRGTLGKRTGSSKGKGPRIGSQTQEHVSGSWRQGGGEGVRKFPVGAKRSSEGAKGVTATRLLIQCGPKWTESLVSYIPSPRGEVSHSTPWEPW